MSEPDFRGLQDGHMVCRCLEYSCVLKEEAPKVQGNYKLMIIGANKKEEDWHTAFYI